MIIFLLFFSYFRWNKTFHLAALPKWIISFTFLLKVVIGGFFVYIYTYYYGEGTLAEDAGVYIRESQQLKAVFDKSPGDYFNLLFGFDSNGELATKYLQETSHWDTGSVSFLNDNRFFIKLNSLIHFISFGQVSVHVIVLSAISTVAVKQLYLAIEKHSLLKREIVFGLLLLIPSLLFWSSGIAKEAIMILGFSLLIRGLIGQELSMWKKVILSLCGALLLTIFKTYVLFAMIPAILCYWLYKWLPRFKLIGSTILLGILIMTCFSFFSKQKNDFIQLITRKQYDFYNVARGGIHAHQHNTFYYFSSDKLKALQIEKDSIKIINAVNAVSYKHGDISNPKVVQLQPDDDKMFIYFQNKPCNGLIQSTPINNSYKRLILNIPEALINVLFRPFPGDAGRPLKYLALIEVVCIYFLLLLSLLRRRTLTHNQVALIFSTLVFIISLSLFIGWVTPVIGAIVRYRVPSFIGLVFIALVLFKPNFKLNRNE